MIRRPKPRKIAAAESDPEDSPPKPAKPKKKKEGGARLSFVAAATEDTEPAFTPRKSALSRRAIERNARKAFDAAAAEERVSYSREDLAALKSAQLVATGEGEGGNDDDDNDDDDDDGVGDDDNNDGDDGDSNTNVIAAAAAHPTTEIPDSGLVRVLKARRAERAAAQKAGVNDFISLSASDGGGDDDGNELALRPKKKKESRLARPDDFDDADEIANYVDDDAAAAPGEAVLLTNSKASRRARARRRQQTIRETIAEAEGASGAESDVSSLAGDWERDQIRKGVFLGSEREGRGVVGELEALARNPPSVLALPKIADVVARLQGELLAMRGQKMQAVRMVENLTLEKQEIREREGMVQARLSEAGEQYERLKRETDNGGGGGGGLQTLE